MQHDITYVVCTILLRIKIILFLLCEIVKL